MGAYIDVTWTDDQLIDSPTLNQMTTNDRWLFDRIIQSNFTSQGKTTGLKMASGVAVVPPGPSYQQQTVGFGNFFTVGCQPIVVVSHAGDLGTITTIGGPLNNQATPDHTQFHFGVLQKDGKAVNFTQYVYWIALGW